MLKNLRCGRIIWRSGIQKINDRPDIDGRILSVSELSLSRGEPVLIVNNAEENKYYLVRCSDVINCHETIRRPFRDIIKQIMQEKPFSFEITSRFNDTLARTGIIHTPHGDIKTPRLLWLELRLMLRR